MPPAVREWRWCKRVASELELPCAECGKPIHIVAPMWDFRTYEGGPRLHGQCAENRARWMAEVDEYMEEALSQ